MDWKGNPQWSAELKDIIAQGEKAGDVPTWQQVATKMNAKFGQTAFTANSVRTRLRRMDETGASKPPRAPRALQSVSPMPKSSPSVPIKEQPQPDEEGEWKDSLERRLDFVERQMAKLTIDRDNLIALINRK
jgi:hypothetical protein